MVKFLIGLITGVLLVFLGFIFLVFVLVQFREKPPRIAENSVLVLRLEGDIPEKPPLALPAFLGAGGPTLTVANVWMTLQKAAADAHIKAIVLEPDGLSTGGAKL